MIRQKNSQSGFTFIEIMIALIILATAITTLLGMQGAAVARTVRDKEAQQAMLLARRLMASIEALPRDVKLEPFDDVTGLAALQQYSVPDPADEASKKALALYRVSLGFEDVTLPLPNFEDKPILKLNLRVSWGSEADEAFLVTHLILK